MLLNVILDRNLRCNPKKEALVDKSYRYTYEQTVDRVNRCSNVLLGLGVKRGDRVAVLAKNCCEYIISDFGIFQIGAVLVPLNWRLTAPEMEFIIKHSDAKTLIFGPEFLEMIMTLKPDLQAVEHFIMIGQGQDALEGIQLFERRLSEASPEKPAVETREDDVAIQMYTSGTTGVPKGAMLTHRNNIFGAYQGIIAMQINSEGRSLYVAPLFHVAATNGALTTLLVGGTLVLLEQFDLKEFLDTIVRQRITHTFLAPTMLRMLVNMPGVEDYDLSSLSTICFGGEPMTYELLTDCIRVFQCDFLQGFGQTEASPSISLMNQEAYRKIAKNPELRYLLRSVGKETPGNEIRIVDEDDQDVPINIVGEILVRGDNTMIGYYKMPEETEKTLRGGWLHTGDLGKFDEDGFLYLADRKKDMIISGAENIYTIEIENTLMRLDGVAEAAVIGIPHEKWGEVPKAFIAQKPGSDLTEEKVIKFCTQNLAKFKCPKEVTFMDALPRNAFGKVLKIELRKL